MLWWITALFKGELGVTFNFDFDGWGVRPEASFGYYTDQFWNRGNPGYLMMPGGMELHRKISDSWYLGYGAGFLSTRLYGNIDGQEISRSDDYPGVSNWLTLLHKPDREIAEDQDFIIDLRLRWNRILK